MSSSVSIQAECEVVVGSGGNDTGVSFRPHCWHWRSCTSVELTLITRVVDPIPQGVTRIANLAFATDAAPPDCSIDPPPAQCALSPPEPPATAPNPQLMLTKQADRQTAPPGGSVVFTITVANVGDVDLHDVVVSDPLAAGVTDMQRPWVSAARL